MTKPQSQRDFPRPPEATGILGQVSSFRELNEDAQAAWRDWFQHAISPGGDLWDAARNCADLRMSVLDGLDLSGLNLAGAMFDDSSLVESQLDDSILPRTSFRRCDLSKCTLKGADLTGADFRWSLLSDTDFSGAVFGTSASFFRTHGDRTNFSNAELVGAYFVDAHFTETDFSDASMRGSHLDGITVIRGRFTGSDISNASIQNGVLLKCSFQGTNLASCMAAKADFSDSNFNSANLSGCELAGARFVSCRITDCRMLEASMTGASFESARLADLDLSELSLESVILLHAVTENCSWPSMAVGVSLTGKLRLPASLPRQPLEDIFGVPSHIRRTGRMSQYLRDLEISSKPNFFASAGFRLWGITSGYGLSISRWFVCCVSLVALFGVGLYLASYSGNKMFDSSGTATSAQLSLRESTPRELGPDRSRELPQLKLKDALMLSASVFLSIEAEELRRVTTVFKTLVVLEVLASYIMLGGLVTIFTTKMVGL